MTAPLHRRHLLRAALGLGGLAWLPAARACEFFSPNLRITHPWTCASEPEASTAVVCMRFDQVLQDDRLVGVDTMLATGAQLGTATRPGVDAAPAQALPFDIPAGRETLLSDKATYLLLTGLTQPLHVGRAYPMTLHFARGGEVPAQLTVDYPSFRFS
jgi:copper(I)-binding protein